ncbi:hypothetical protein [Leeuwenhoekiella parthenopeia]|uniref:Uncharacterized protein n=1 Tax=Leeuwenhoekiella parthenopeia TaxID=2890320 RepID=A0ABS8GXE2_9FLAO|nr:hypothetical protein [Leeuwenhoekiella parthenopeia]MCC4213862.1 hypothetical protein [Leeuwenhoekiella parthenopeia]
MRLFLSFFSLFFVQFVIAQTNSHLDAQVSISLSEETFDAVYVLKNLPVNSQKLSFKLNKHFKVKQVYLNNDPIASSKYPQNCNDCLTHNININRPLNNLDHLKIEISGKIKNLETDKDVRRHKGEVVLVDGVLLAGANDYWYPQVVRTSGSLSEYINPFNMTYSITATCADCDQIYLGKGTPKNSGATFSNDRAEGDITLIAGTFDFKEGTYANYINVSDTDIQKIQTRFSKSQQFLEEFTQFTGKQSKTVYAQLESPIYGNEANYNTIVNTSAKVDLNKVDENLTEDTAYYYFASNFEPKTKLDRLFLQALAKYARIKYLETNNRVQYDRLTGIVQTGSRAEKPVESQSQLQALLITPGQFLELEQRIGAEEMQSFLKNTFQNLAYGKSSYEAFTESIASVNTPNTNLEVLITRVQDQFKLRAAERNTDVLVGF